MRDRLKPFHLISGALFDARSGIHEDTYQRWRTFLKRLESYRGYLDPIADQNANIDVLLRSTEETIEQEMEHHGNLDHEKSGYQLHLHLSRLWVLGSYEYLRTLHVLVKRHDHPVAVCMRNSNSKGCGESNCVCCAIGHLKNETALVRMVLAKNAKAKDVKNPPLTEAMRLQIMAEPLALAPPFSKFLCEGEGQIGGTIAWHVYDQRVDRHRVISRRDLSDRILSGLNGIENVCL